jgi:hypothetical protein
MSGDRVQLRFRCGISRIDSSFALFDIAWFQSLHTHTALLHRTHQPIILASHHSDHL